MTTTWPDGVIARYLTVGGATVDVIERAGYYDVKHPTETQAACTGCSMAETFEWGWSPSHAEFGTGPQPNFDEGGRWTTPEARDWAQAHAETCRAMPKPTTDTRRQRTR